MTSPAPALPRATVVICVYTEKRWDDIVAAVGSVQAQDVRAAEVLVVVDHNPALLDRAREAFGEDVRVLPNAHRQGLSGARNTAVAAASGDVVVFLDDDAAARPGWLGALLAPVRRPRRRRGGRGRPPRVPRAPGRACCPPAERVPTPRASSTGSSAAPTPASRPSRPRCATSWGATCRCAARCSPGSAASPRTSAGSARNPLGCEETELCIRVRQSLPPDGSRGADRLRARGAGRPPGERRPGRGGRTCDGAAGRRACRRRRCRSWWAATTPCPPSAPTWPPCCPERWSGSCGRGRPASALAIVDGPRRDGCGVPARQAARRDVGGAAAGRGRRPAATALRATRDLPAANRTGGA